VLKTRTRCLATALAAGVVFLPALQTFSQEQTETKAASAPQNNNAAESQTAESKPKERIFVPTNRYVAPDDLMRTGFSGHIKDFVEDQKQIWTSPVRIRLSDANWLVPLGGITAGLFVTDRQYSASISRNPTTLKHYTSVSNYGIAGLIGGGAGLYLLSFPTHNERWRETGFLAGEAALNSLVTVEAFKYSLGRERPYQGNGSGAFFHGGTSFPSEHAAAAWSIAGVFAHEYPGTIPSLFAYGAASAVSLSRVKAHQHFPSDVLVGSVLGYLIAQNVYRHRHNPEVGGAAWESPHEFVSDDKVRTPSFMGSPYVPLDSWIYPALERLAALGYVKSASLGIRPWTRLECARLLSEAGELQPETDTPSEVQQLYSALSEEFAHDSDLMAGESNRSAQFESVYFRTLGISGKPLTDNYHFGQTILNDYGRPYQEGFNSVAGISGWTTAGPFVIYTRGEFQSAPSAPSLPPAALNFIANVDGLPPNPPSLPFASTSRFQLIDAYVGMNIANWQFSFGRRSLWWGPSESGTMILTNNIAPLNKMFSIDRITPVRLPWLFGYLGDIRLTGFIGQLSGQEFLSTTFSGKIGPDIGQYGHELRPQPFLSGGRISFKLTQNFEINLSKTTLYGGPGDPLTPNTFFKSTFGIHVHGDVLGDGRTGADFAYRIPKMRDWLTFYGEAMSEDQISPIPYMRQSIFQGGLYFAKIPRVPKVDVRLEGGSTSAAGYNIEPPGYFYWNAQYVNGYNSGGGFIGSWLGRAAQGESVRTNYWFSAKNKIGLELRHRKVAHPFLPQGGTQNDVAVNADFFTGQGLSFSGKVQYERWLIPLMATNRQSNIAASFQLSFWPRHDGALHREK
jgi:membrane-associated phospholipid phosphatase